MKHRSWFWGIFFLAAGLFVLASQFGGFVHLGFWSVAATVLLAAVLVGSLPDLNFFGVFVPASLLYAIYQRPLHWPAVSVWVLLLAAVLASTGFSIIFRGRFHRHWEKWARKEHWERWAGGDTMEENVDGNDVFVRGSFSEACRYLHAESLERARLISSFGKLSVYFDGVALSPNGADVYVDASFGEMDLYVPRGWRVQDNVRTGFGAVTREGRQAEPAADAPVLRLKGRVSFGNLQIRTV